MALKTVFILAFQSFSFGFFGQLIVRETIGTFGSSAKSEGVLIQQTVGQPSATIFSPGENKSGIRQGFHQPFYFLAERNELNAIIYPNPNNGQFSFQVDLPVGTLFTYELTDQNGRKVLEKLGEGSIRIPVLIEQPATGMYHLQIAHDKRISSFKINVIE